MPELVIVTGFAGAGKSTVCQQYKAKGYIYVPCDDWVNETYQNKTHGYKFITNLLGESILREDGSRHICKKKLAAALLADAKLNSIVVNYFTSSFAAHLATVFRYALGANLNHVVEIPYLDNSIVWLKKQFPEVKVIKINAEPIILTGRLTLRGWDDKRIQATMDLYASLMNSIKPDDLTNLISETVVIPLDSNEKSAKI